MSVGSEDAETIAKGDTNVATAILFVQRPGERVDDAVHGLVPTLTGVSVVALIHVLNRSCNQRIFDS